MVYNGVELTEVTEPQLFNPPKTMVVWDSDAQTPYKALVYAIVTGRRLPVITKDGAYDHCAEIPESPKVPVQVTRRELARWLADGNGQYRIGTKTVAVCTCLSYVLESEDKPVPQSVFVRKWGDAEWHTPTPEYLGLEDE